MHNNFRGLPSKQNLSFCCGFIHFFSFPLKTVADIFIVSLQLLVTKSFHRKHVHNQNIHTSEGSKHTHTVLQSAVARATLEGCALILTLR